MDKLLIEMYQKNIAEVTDCMSAPIRFLGWSFIKLLANICNALENTVTQIYTLNGFFNSNGVNEFINTYKPVIWAILAVSIAVIAVKIIFNKKQNRDQLPANLIFSICVVALLPIFMVKMNDATTVVVKDLNGSNKTSANTIVKNNISDLQYLDKTNYDLKEQKNNISAENILNIEINEELDIDKISSRNKDIFKKRVVVDEKGELKTEKIKSGLFGIGGENYYRYNINSFFTIIITLATTCITLICIALKVARLEFELGFNKLFATLFAFADIDDGKKIREILKHIGSIFAVLVAMSVMVKMYVLFTVWIGNVESSNEIDDITKMIVLVGVSVGVIDGPNIVERIFGIDAGLKDGWRTMMGAYGAARAAAGAGKAAIGAGKTAVKGAKMLGKGAVVGASTLAGTIGTIDGYDAKRKSMGKLSDNINKSNEKDKETANNKPTRLNEEMNKQSNSNASSEDSKCNENIKLSDNKPQNSLQSEMNSNKASINDKKNTNRDAMNNVNKLEGSILGNEMNGTQPSTTLNSEMGNSVEKSDSLGMDGINNKGIDEDGSTLQDEINQYKDDNNTIKESDMASMSNHDVDTPKLKESMNCNSNNLSKNGINGLETMKTAQNGFDQSSNPIKESDVAAMSNHDTDIPKLQDVMDDNSNNLSKNGINGLETMKTAQNGFDQSSNPIKESDVAAMNNHDIDTSKLQESMDNNSNGSSVNNPNNDVQKSNESANNAEGKSSDANNKDNANVETRTIGQYFNDKINNNPSYNRISRAYDLGRNTGSKWAVNRHERKIRKKESDK